MLVPESQKSEHRIALPKKPRSRLASVPDVRIRKRHLAH
jgi:hypothetical protein